MFEDEAIVRCRSFAYRRQASSDSVDRVVVAVVAVEGVFGFDASGLGREDDFVAVANCCGEGDGVVGVVATVAVVVAPVVAAVVVAAAVGAACFGRNFELAAAAAMAEVAAVARLARP